MIEYKHDKKLGGVSLRIEGNVQEITADVAMLVSMVYGAIHEDNPLAALEYRLALVNSLTSTELEDLIWSEKASSGGTKVRVDADMMQILTDLVNKDDDDEGE